MPKPDEHQRESYARLDALGLAVMQTIPHDVFDAMYDTFVLYGVEFEEPSVRRAFHAIGKFLADIAEVSGSDTPELDDLPTGDKEALAAALTKLSLGLVACAGYASEKEGS